MQTLDLSNSDAALTAQIYSLIEGGIEAEGFSTSSGDYTFNALRPHEQTRLQKCYRAAMDCFNCRDTRAGVTTYDPGPTDVPFDQFPEPNFDPNFNGEPHHAR